MSQTAQGKSGIRLVGLREQHVASARATCQRQRLRRTIAILHEMVMEAVGVQGPRTGRPALRSLPPCRVAGGGGGWHPTGATHHGARARHALARCRAVRPCARAASAGRLMCITRCGHCARSATTPASSRPAGTGSVTCHTLPSAGMAATARSRCTCPSAVYARGWSNRIGPIRASHRTCCRTVTGGGLPATNSAPPWCGYRSVREAPSWSWHRARTRGCGGKSRARS